MVPAFRVEGKQGGDDKTWQQRNLVKLTPRSVFLRAERVLTDHVQ